MPLTDELEKEIEQAVQETEVPAEAETDEAEATTGVEANETETTATQTTEETTGESVDDIASEGIGDGEVSGDGEITADETTTEETITKETPALSNEVLERAVAAGIPVTDARELPPESLVRVIEAREEAFALDETKLRDELEEGSGEISDPFADIPKLDPETHEPEVVAAFEKLTAITKEQAKQIQDFQTQQKETSLAAEEAGKREIRQWFDREVGNLGEDFIEALGSGSYDSLDRGSPQFENRDKIAGQMSVLWAGYAAHGQEPPPREDVFDMAARLVLRDEYEAIHERKLAGDLGKRASQHIQRTGGQKASSVQTPEEEAAAAVDKRYFSK